MPAPLSMSGATSAAGAWQELEDVFAGLGQLARTSTTPDQFYRTLLEESLRALSASGGAVWLRAPDGAFQLAVQLNWPIGEFSRDPDARRAHEQLLADAASGGHSVTVLPRHAHDGLVAANPTEFAMMIAPVQTSGDDSLTTGLVQRPVADRSTAPTPPNVYALIELMLRADAGPAAYRGCEEFLTAVSELAADFHAFEELRRLQRNQNRHDQLVELCTQVHRQLDLASTAYTVANEGRRVVGCDRLSVLGARGARCRLLATSGVARAERRSGVARRLEELAEMVRRTDEPVYYDDGATDALPPIAAVLEAHAEESHARRIAAVPLRLPNAPGSDERVGSFDSRHNKPRFVLVAEQFDALDGDLHRERLTEVSRVSATALENALTMDRLPLGWLWRSLGAVKLQFAEHLPRSLALASLAVGAVAALVLIPAEFKVDATGTLQPVVQREVFAPRGGLVDEVLVKHGANVTVGQPLVRLRDPMLDLEIKKAFGELETTQKQIAAVRATRTNRAIRDANPADSYRLSAEERELDQRLTNLRRELELLNVEREKLVVTSPIAGNVLTWDVDNRLNARPVERGEVLLTIANLDDDWRLELDVPDDRIGHVFAAQQELQPDLAIDYRLSSDDRELHEGRLVEICQTADPAAEGAATPAPTVLVRVALDPDQLSDARRPELRPGISARAQIACGRKSLGYVWFHDVWDAAWEWLQF